MKQIIRGALHRPWHLFATNFTIMFLLALSVTLLTTGCQKSISEEATPQVTSNAQSDGNVLNLYTGLSEQTKWELQQARAASARYRDIKNAIKDGYEDISVVVPQMGHHYMKMDNVDGNFDYRNPEILVYNFHGSNAELVAVEYAIPLSQSINAPEGFSGTADVWDENTGFGLWLLHAWVWKYNAAGVFNPTNAAVHLD